MPADSLGELFEAVSLSDARVGTLHQRLCAELRRAILEGRLAPGARLPSSRALALRLCVSRNTVNAAFEQLLAEGYLVARPGSGTYVATCRGPVPAEPAPAGRPPAQGAPLAQRGLALGEASRLVQLLRDRQATPIRPFRVGTPALDAFPRVEWRRAVARALRRMPPTAYGDGDPAGLHRLRSAIAGYLGTHRGIRCDPGRVVVTAGSQQALDLIARVTTDPGDTVWMEDPGYFGAQWCLRAAGVALRGIPVDSEGLLLPAGHERGRPRLIYCTPAGQMPLGMPMSLDRRSKLLAFAADTGAWVIEDDYDSEYRYGSRPFPTLYESDPTGRVIYIGTFSKTLFPGIRIGFAILPEPLVSPVTIARLVSAFHPPALEQYALADFIESGAFARHVRRSRARYAQRAEVLAEAVARWLPSSCRLHRPRSGLSAWLEVDETVDEQAIAAAAAATGIELMPVSAFTVERARPRGFILGFAPHAPEALSRAVRDLAELLVRPAR
jgi:GntR family transcriptional regulator/MocR family aminotransferase